MISQTIYTKEIIKIMKFLYSRRISELYFTIENNGLGSGVLRLIENANEPVLDKAVFISDVNEDGSPSKRLGMYTTNRSKLAGCTQLKDVIELGKLTIYSELLLTQLKFFIRKGASYEAERGMKDDLVMPLVIMMNMFKQIAFYNDNTYSLMNEIDDDVDDDVWGISF